MLSQKGFIFLKAINQVLLLEPLLAPTRWLRGNNTAFYLCFDTVGTWLVLVASDLSLLAQYAAGASS
jgi:hypothetical protein